MIALYCTSPQHQAGIERVLAPRARLVVPPLWERLDEMLGQVRQAVIVFPQLDGECAHHLRLLRLRHPTVSLVLVTAMDIENARRLKNLPVDDVVWLGEERDRLCSAVERARRGVLLTLANAIENHPLMSVRLRIALSHACRSQNPVRFVYALARVCGFSRATLNVEWRRAMGGDALTLADFLDWLLLIRALLMRSERSSWAKVADDLGTYQSVLSRLARRLTGSPLHELFENEMKTAWGGFREHFLDRLLSGKYLPVGSPPTLITSDY